jgi:hypothetical protein
LGTCSASLEEEEEEEEERRLARLGSEMHGDEAFPLLRFISYQSRAYQFQLH